MQKLLPNIVFSPRGKDGALSSLTWFFYHIQDGLPTGVFIVLESDNTVFLIFIGTIHCIFSRVLWSAEGQNMEKWKTCQFLEDEVYSNSYHWSSGKTWQETLCLTLVTMPRFKITIIPGSHWPSLIYFVPNRPIWFLFLLLEGTCCDNIMHSDSKPVSPLTNCVILDKLFELIEFLHLQKKDYASLIGLMGS